MDGELHKDISEVGLNDPNILTDGYGPGEDFVAPVMEVLEVSEQNVHEDKPSERNRMSSKKPQDEAIDENLDWMKRTECKEIETNTFYPFDSEDEKIKIAKRICGHCAVKEQCLNYALKYRIEHGIWGGTTEVERRRILRGRRGSA